MNHLIEYPYKRQTEAYDLKNQVNNEFASPNTTYHHVPKLQPFDQLWAFSPGSYFCPRGQTYDSPMIDLAQTLSHTTSDDQRADLFDSRDSPVIELASSQPLHVMQPFHAYVHSYNPCSASMLIL